MKLISVFVVLLAALADASGYSDDAIETQTKLFRYFA